MSKRFILPWLCVVAGLIGVYLQAYDSSSILGQVLTRTGLILTIAFFITVEITERAKSQAELREGQHKILRAIDNAATVCYYSGRADSTKAAVELIREGGEHNRA